MNSRKIFFNYVIIYLKMKRIILLSVFLLAIKAYSIDRATQLVVDDSGLKHVYHGYYIIIHIPKSQCGL